MKRILTIILLSFFAIAANAQVQTIGNKNNTVQVLGKLKVDTGFIPPYVLKPAAQEGSIAYSVGTHSLHVKTNTGWVEIPFLIAGSGTYLGLSPTTVAVGGLAQGTNIYGMSIQAILEAILVPYQQPAFATFTMSGQATEVEVGTTVSGSKTFTWTFTNGANVAANSMDILNVTDATTLSSNVSITPPQVKTINETYNVPTTHTWRGRADATNATTFTADFNIDWKYSIYSGKSVGDTPTNVEILANFAMLSSTNDRTSFSIPITGGDHHIYLAAPASYGDLTSIMVGVFESLPAFNKITRNVTNAQGVTTSYYIYVSQNVFSEDVNLITAQ